MERPTVQFGKLTVGDTPRVVGTVSTWEFLRRIFDPPCDIVEVRLDLIGTDAGDWLAECRRLRSLDIPVILTIRLASEGGRWSRPDEERLDLFRAAQSCVGAMDVELRSALTGLAAPVIVSFHDFEKTPPLPALENIVTQATQRGSVVKVATLLHTEKDVQTLQQLLGQQRPTPLCVMGMGALGAATRVELPLLGSCLTYGYLDAPVAPGQVSAAHLRAAIPAR